MTADPERVRMDEYLRALMATAKKGRSRPQAFGYTFGSEPERTRFLELRNMQLAGEIRTLIVHPEYEIAPPTLDARHCPIARLGYTADFEYEERDDDGNWVEVTEEVKPPVKYHWHMSPKGKIGKKKDRYQHAQGEDYVMRINLFRRSHPRRIFREIRME